MHRRFSQGVTLSFVLLGLCLGALHLSAQECATPVISAINAVSTSEIHLSWIDFSPDTSKRYELQWIAFGEQPNDQPDTTQIQGTTLTIDQLQSGTLYKVRIRSRCGNEISTWNQSSYVPTFIENENGCNLQMPIQDQNCDDPQIFTISVDQFPSGLLGENTFLRSIDLIIQHDWLADLSLKLISPTGKTVLLSADIGVGDQNYGDPGDQECLNVLSFTPDACQSISDPTNLYNGEFVPLENLDAVHDSSAVNGNWQLELCDKAIANTGILKYVHLGFSENACMFKPEIQFHDVLDTAAIFSITNPQFGDSIVVYIFETDVVYERIFPVADEIRIGDLSLNTVYSIFAKRLCNGNLSAASCEVIFRTSCNYLSEYESFNAQASCNTTCGSQCDLEGLWQNDSNSNFHWIVNQGPTPTSSTGPSSDLRGYDKYLYVETSSESCPDDAEAILESTCLFFDLNENACHFNFWYFMAGVDVNSLAVEITIDDGVNWERIWELTGAQGNEWQQASLNLDSNYDGLIGRIRFVGTHSEGSFGDIAIDEIQMSGIREAVADDLLFYYDFDQDGFGGDSIVWKCLTIPPSGLSSQTGDCNDDSETVYPGAEEIPCNLIDEDCDGMADDSVSQSQLQYQVFDFQMVSCTGKQDGRITIFATGGQSPYTFQWNNGSVGPVLSQIGPGIYQCRIEDANGCATLTEFFEVTAQEVLSFFLTDAQSPTCNGINDGQITTTVTGGTEPLNVIWNTNDTTFNIQSLSGGNYHATITDANQCFVISDNIELESPEAFQLAISKDHISCPGFSDGELRAHPITGIPPFSYEWSNGDTSRTINNLSQGSYALTVTDQSGCLLTRSSIILEEPDSMKLIFDAIDEPLCPGGQNGVILISMEGGTSPYYYHWNNNLFVDDLHHVSAGSYQLTVTDDNGCELIDTSIVVNEPDSIMILIDSLKGTDCQGISNGSVSIEVSGGTPGYQYFWSNGNTQTQEIMALAAGNYDVAVADQRGCKAILRDIHIHSNDIPIPIQLLDSSVIYCHGDSNASLVVEVLMGTPPFSYNWSAGLQHVTNGTTDSITSLPAGQYTVTVTDGRGCVGESQHFILEEPPELIFTVDKIIDNQCFGTPDGSIALNINGGVSPRSYVWNTGDTTSQLLNAVPGQYSLMITDQNNCQLKTPLFTIWQADSVFITFDVQHGNAGQPGGATVNIQGGQPPYSYQWDEATGSQTGKTATDLEPATYLIEITDGNGCIYVDSVLIEISISTSPTLENAWLVYPNPTSGELFIQWKAGGEPAFEIFDLRGIRIPVKKELVSENLYRIDLRVIHSGYYLLRETVTGTNVPLILLDVR